MSYATKLRGTLPKDRDNNGLAVIRNQLLQAPLTQHVAIVVLDCWRIIEEVDDLVRTPVARIVRIEPETDADRAVELLARARELSEARNQRPDPLLDPQEASGVLRTGTGLRLASSSDGTSTGGGRR